ncbi:MAG: hypothetical protein MRY74_07015 [Neomegalonema sp.]|nr:hypothetical protein [Neomegalonema sp.]
MDAVFLLTVGVVGLVLGAVLFSDSARPLSRLHFWMYQFFGLAGAVLLSPALALGFGQLGGPTYGATRTLSEEGMRIALYGLAAGAIFYLELAAYLWVRRMGALGFSRFWVVLLFPAVAIALLLPWLGAPFLLALLSAPGFFEGRAAEGDAAQQMLALPK